MKLFLGWVKLGLMKRRERFILDQIYDEYKKQVKKNVNSIKKKTNLITRNYRYTGEVNNNKPNGWGKLIEVSKKNPKPFCTNVGKFRNGRLNGLGYIQFGHPLIHIGYFKNGSLDGQGRVLYGSLNPKSKDKSTFGYEGEFKKGSLDGYGVEFGGVFSKLDRDKNKIKVSEIVYKGQWYRGEPHGKGINYFGDIFVCDGNWKYKFAHGECTIQFYGKDILKGIWKNGKLIKKISEEGNTDAYTRSTFEVLRKGMEDEGLDGEEITQRDANYRIKQRERGE
jgi:hypothetical protein